MREEDLLNGWLPYRIIIDNGKVKFRWFYAGTQPFTEPFFEESIAACLSLPQNGHGAFPVTSAETMLEVAQRADAVSPAGFIYHISRCGSTLLSQMLVCDPETIVLSEVPLLDELLRLRFRTEAKSYPPVEAMFKAVMKLLGRKRSGTERRMFVKTDSWHVLFYEELRQWYPDAAALLMFRSPAEVAASHSRSPAMHAVPGLIEAQLFGLDAEEVLHMQREEYLEHVLCCYLRKYMEILQRGDDAAALDYHSGAWTMMQTLFAHCGFHPSGETVHAMKQRTQFHSKKTESMFAGDAAGGTEYGFAEAGKLFTALQHSLKKEAHGT
jgi:hypothetical protein